MRKRFPWFTLVILLLGILFLREPRFQKFEELFLGWLMENSVPAGPDAPLTVVEIVADRLAPNTESPAPTQAPSRPVSGSGMNASPLEHALFLQAALELNPAVIAFEPVLLWRDRDKDQEQIFLDQAMRVPKLLLGAELSTTHDPDTPVPEIPSFPNVTGKRAALINFTGIDRQPDEEMRLIATLGFTNLPEEFFSHMHVPLLFQYRGEVIPSFTLQALMLWLRVTPGEVRIDLEKEIELPQGRRIPIKPDGTVLVNFNAAKRAQRLSMNELLDVAQSHAKPAAGQTVRDLNNEIVLARTPRNPLSPPDVFAATIVTIQNELYPRRVHWMFDCVLLVTLVALANPLRRFSRIDLMLSVIAFSAGYCMLALTLLKHANIWLPGILPLGAVWILVIFTVILPTEKNASRTVAIAASPPVP